MIIHNFLSDIISYPLSFFFSSSFSSPLPRIMILSVVVVVRGGTVVNGLCDFLFPSSLPPEVFLRWSAEGLTAAPAAAALASSLKCVCPTAAAAAATDDRLLLNNLDDGICLSARVVRGVLVLILCVYSKKEMNQKKVRYGGSFLCK